MGNYNPRQNTRMRWKDERELEKFSFLYGDFDIQAEQLENVSQDENWSKVANLFKNYDKNTNNKKGVILYDYLQYFLCTGYLTGQYLYLYSVSETGVTYITIDYDIKIDSMRIYVEDETFISEDNIKTLFGQDITGTGDINLYRHELIISTGRTSYDETEYKVYLTYYSSNNLVANTPEKLKTLTKANTTTILRGIVLEFANAGVTNATVSGKYSGVNYLGDQSGWALEKVIGGSDGTAITIVSDEVTPISYNQ